MKLEYISYDEFCRQKYPTKLINTFDCGFKNFNNFIHNRVEDWQLKLNGVTYFLIDKDEKDKNKCYIYAFATLSTAGFLYGNKGSQVKKYISAIEIKLFAIHKSFRNKYDNNNIKYSHLFFAILLQDIWSMALNKLSFKVIFLEANEPGKQLYLDFGFIEMKDFIAPTEDDKIEINDCIPMICSVSDELMYRAFL